MRRPEMIRCRDFKDKIRNIEYNHIGMLPILKYIDIIYSLKVMQHIQENIISYYLSPEYYDRINGLHRFGTLWNNRVEKTNQGSILIPI